MGYTSAIYRQAAERAAERAEEHVISSVISKLAPIVKNKVLPLAIAADVVNKTEKEFVLEAKEFGYDLSEFLSKE